jgi:hypothetical protein
MKYNRPLIVSSLLSIALFSVHLAGDIMYGLDKFGLNMMTAFAILTLLLYGTLVRGARRSGHIIMLLGGIFSLGMPVIHVRGTSLARIIDGGGWLFVWTLLALGTLGMFTIVLAARELWIQRRGGSSLA